MQESGKPSRSTALPAGFFSLCPSTLLLESWDLVNASAVEQENKSSFSFRALAQSSGTLKLSKCCMHGSLACDSH